MGVEGEEGVQPPLRSGIHTHVPPRADGVCAAIHIRSKFREVPDDEEQADLHI